MSRIVNCAGTAALCAAIVVFLAVPTFAENAIPNESLDILQDVFRAACDRLWELNDQFWHQGDYERCIAVLRLITELDPRDTEAFGNAAWLMWNAGRVEESEAFLKKGLALNPDVDSLYFELGMFYFNAGRYLESIDQLETAVTMDTHWRTWHLLAHAYERAGHADEALKIWFMMEARDPTFVVPQMQIGRLLYGEGRTRGSR